MTQKNWSVKSAKKGFRVLSKIENYIIWDEIDTNLINRQWDIMTQKSKKFILVEMTEKIKNPRNSLNCIKTLLKPFLYDFWPFLVILEQKKNFSIFGSDDPISPKVPIPRYSSSWRPNSFSGILLWLIPTTYQKLSGKSWLWDEPTYLLKLNYSLIL